MRSVTSPSGVLMLGVYSIIPYSNGWLHITAPLLVLRL